MPGAGASGEDGVVSPGSGDSIEYRFGDVVVQPASHRVLKDGVEVPLEPKALAVLVELLRHPQIVVERDQLLDRVWGHSFVTPGVLNRIIALLRKALGDDADHPRYIRTVHGVGYSFIGELATAHEPPPPAAVPPSAEARPPRPRKAWPVVLAIVLTALLGGWWVATHRGESAGPPPAAGAQSAIRLALLPISAVDPTDEVLARGLTDVLGEALSRIPEIELVEQESARLAVSRTDDPRKIADLLGTDRLMRIRLGRHDEDAVLSVELLDGRDGKPAWSRQLVQRRNALTGVIGPLLSSLRTVLLPGAPPARLDPIVRADAVAQALYLETRATLIDDAESRGRNRALLEQAVQQDPAFALGWAALANARRERFSTGEANLEEAMTEAQEAVDRALEIDPDLVEALLVQCNIKTNQWRSSEALGPSRRAIELAPNDARAVGARANVLGYLARPRESLELRRRAIELNPLSPFPVWTMSTDYLMLGDRDRALEQFAKALAMSGSGNSVGAFGARLELAFGNPADAILRYRRNPDQATRYALYIPLAAVQALVAIGELGEAEALFDSLHPRLPYTPNYLETKLALLWAEGRYAAAVAWLDGPGRDAAQDPYQTVARAHARVLAGDIEGALADYASGLEGPAERDLIFNMWWPTRLGPAELGNWIALRKANGSDYDAELKDLKARLQRAADAGTHVPVLAYYRAVVAVLRDDPKAADAALTEARNNGWFDPLALEVDLAWRPYWNAGWFQAQKQWLADKAKRERALLAAG
jgi:DNA-binding winged helix-turn-helix (wHTH) protein/tetratricopeptide (TPR) repeat protein/TolB-like protein